MTAQRKITATVSGDQQINTFEAMCFLHRRRPHQMVNDIVLAAIREEQANVRTQRIVRDMLRARRGIQLVRDA